MRSIRKTSNYRKRNMRKSKKNNRKTKKHNRKGGGAFSEYDCRHFLRASPRNIKRDYCGKTSGYTNLGNYCMNRAKRIGKTQGFAPKFVDITGDRWCEAVREKPIDYSGFRAAQQLRARRMAEQAERERQRQMAEKATRARQMANQATRARRMANQATRARTRTRIPVSRNFSINNLDFDAFSSTANNFIRTGNF